MVCTLFTPSYFSYLENSITFVIWVFILSLEYSFCEQNVGWKMMISLLFSYMVTIYIFPYISLPMFTIPFVSMISLSIPSMESSVEMKQKSIWKMKSILFLSLQSFVCVLTFTLSTFFCVFH